MINQQPTIEEEGIMSLDCIERTDKEYVYPWIVIDLDNDNKQISCGKTCDDAWYGAAESLDNTLFEMRETLRKILKD